MEEINKQSKPKNIFNATLRQKRKYFFTVNIKQNIHEMQKYHVCLIIFRKAF